jgi:hypothetical protein
MIMEPSPLADHIAVSQHNGLAARLPETEDRGVQVDLPYNKSFTNSLHANGAPVRFDLNPPSPRLQNLQQLAMKLKEAAPRVLKERRVQYQKVKVLSVFWEHGEYTEMRENADAISQTFREHYHFDIQPVPLTNEQPTSDLLNILGPAMSHLSESDKDNLLIIYYCGHGVWDGSGRTFLQPHKDASTNLDWDTIQGVLQYFDGDLLLLFDCCHATAMIKDQVKWKRRCEIFGATNAFDNALANEDKSFTKALQSELQKFSSKGISVDGLRWILTNKEIAKGYNLEKLPAYRLHSNRSKYPSSIFLQSRYVTGRDQISNGHENGIGEERQRSLKVLQAMTDAIMLVAIRLDSTTGPPRFEEWRDMIRAAPHDASSIELTAISIDQYQELLSVTKIHGMFAGSYVLIVSLPIWLWDHMERNPSFQEIGIVRSDNLWTDTIPLEPLPLGTSKEGPLVALRKSAAPSDNEEPDLLLGFTSPRGRLRNAALGPARAGVTITAPLASKSKKSFIPHIFSRRASNQILRMEAAAFHQLAANQTKRVIIPIESRKDTFAMNLPALTPLLECA